MEWLTLTNVGLVFGLGCIGVCLCLLHEARQCYRRTVREAAAVRAEREAIEQTRRLLQLEMRTVKHTLDTRDRRVLPRRKTASAAA